MVILVIIIIGLCFYCYNLTSKQNSGFGKEKYNQSFNVLFKDGHPTDKYSIRKIDKNTITIKRIKQEKFNSFEP